MAASVWGGSSPVFHDANWGGRAWTLDLSQNGPALIEASGYPGRFLGLTGIAAFDRFDPDAFRPQALISAEARSDRVEATYRPFDWPELEVRVSWIVVDSSSLGLEVQVSTRSVGELRGLEVLVDPRTSTSARSEPPPQSRVFPRDRLAAQLSYDGRMDTLDQLITMPIASQRQPIGYSMPEISREPSLFICMFFGDDVSRAIMPVSENQIRRLACFGHDLERGVVLRARIRGVWIPTVGIISRAKTIAEAFQNEPLPLGT